jgi:hypothetical protein
MCQELLRVSKVLALQQKQNLAAGTSDYNRAVQSTDTLGRAAEVLHQFTCSILSLQSVHTQTLLLHSAYLKGFTYNLIKQENQLKLRSAFLLSSQVMPTKVCKVALDTIHSKAGLISAAPMSTTLRSPSQKLPKNLPPPQQAKQQQQGGGGGCGASGSRLSRSHNRKCKYQQGSTSWDPSCQRDQPRGRSPMRDFVNFQGGRGCGDGGCNNQGRSHNQGFKGPGHSGKQGIDSHQAFPSEGFPTPVLPCNFPIPMSLPPPVRERLHLF